MTLSKKSNEFLRSVLVEVPRLLGQLNRNKLSRSYGSFDRAYWHYRTNDISCARYQEAAYTLTLLYLHDFEDNIYYQDDKVLEWIEAALEFTTRIQRSNGSFDEWYLNEGSYVATAFVTAAIGQALLALDESNVKVRNRGKVLMMLEKAAKFLSNTQEKTVMNQVSGAIFAIALVGKLHDNKDLIDVSEKYLNEFISRQDEEGWWMEYGGPDIGYLTLTISYLEKYQRLLASDVVSKPILMAKNFVELFIHPDRTAGGEYMSRNTEYIIPSSTLPYLGAVTPSQLDDRYLSYILYNWIEAGLRTDPKVPEMIQGNTYFKNSGILRVVNPNYFLVVNGNKGGSLRLYSQGMVYYDSGLEVRGGSRSLLSGILDSTSKVEVGVGELRVVGSLKPVKEPLLETRLAVVFKAWQLLFGQLYFMHTRLKKFLRSRMVSYMESTDMSFERDVVYSPGRVVLTDSVTDAIDKKDVHLGSKSSYSAVPSAKYSAVPDLERSRLTPKVTVSTDRGVHTFIRTFDFNDKI